MRIGFVSDVVYPWVTGGVEAIELSEMRELAKRHEVYCFSLRFKGMKRQFVSNGIHYVTVADAPRAGLYNKQGQRSIAAAKAFAEGIAKTISDYSLDVVQANAFPYLHLDAIKRYCIGHGCKLVVDVAEVWDWRRWAEYLGVLRGSAAHYYLRFSNVLGGADAYIANSSVTKRLIEKFGIPSSKISVFSPVLSPEVMRRRGIAGHSMDVIISGRLIKEKRLDMWIDAVAGARALNNEITGTIIGRGPEEAALKARIKQLGLEHAVRVLPFMKSKAGLYRRIAGSGLLLQTSSREGLSVIVLESLALGTPVMLPSDTPVPDEVKRMCVVSWTEDMPKKIAEVLSSKDKAAYLPGTRELDQFSTSSIRSFYSRLFSKLGIELR